MTRKHYDKIQISDLQLPCIIGLREWERTTPQNVNLNITLFTDFSKACVSDEIDDTVDYVTIKKNIIKEVEASSFKLVEKLAQMVAEICLSDARVMRVDVNVSKPGALRFARTVAVEITRTRE
ncbi:MAG: dihydroneopterin aldolase [Kiritimatiellae bacterium]|nr:dihydroneopterin aldolase [Kiritimatiellia bacterium]